MYATERIVDYIRAHPASLSVEVCEAMKDQLSATQVFNTLDYLMKQKRLRSTPVAGTSARVYYVNHDA